MEFSMVEPATEKQVAWRQKSAERIRSQRAQRLQVMKEDRAAVERAVDSYASLGAADTPHITLRGGFVRLPEEQRNQRKRIREIRQGRIAPDHDAEERVAGDEHRARRLEIAGRPPSTRLMRQPAALRLLLTAIFVTQVVEPPGAQFMNRRHNNKRATGGAASWAVAAGLYRAPNGRARRERVKKALTALSDIGLVRLESGRYEGWELLREDGADALYRTPGQNQPGLLVLPSLFFERGWHLVLNPAEITLLLALTELDGRLRRLNGDSEVDRDGVALPESLRSDAYGISVEAYAAAHQLDELDLVELIDPMPHRRRGKINPATKAQRSSARDRDESLEPIPYRFKLRGPTAFDRVAHAAMIKVLEEYPAGLRMTEFPGLEREARRL